MVVESRPAAAVSGTLEAAYTGLSWPTALAFAEDGRIFVAERYSGQILIIENGTILPDPFYTFANLATYHDQGLLGLALDPSFPSAPWVYAYYSYDDVANGTTSNRIVRIQATGNSGGSMDVLLDGIPSGVWHIGGPIQFGPDGKLYAVIGDSYVWANAQNLTNVAGKVLRLNPDGSVPGDNPFVGNASANPYIYTYGHRNNFGIAFHPVTGAAYVTENGPECNDEVNLLIPGRNYGWGPSWTCVPPMPPPPLNTNRDGPNPVLPLVWYSPNIAPTNAIFYDGPDFAAWQGDFFFGTWNTRNVHRLQLAPPNYDSVVSDDVVLTLPSSASGGVVEVEQGLDGAIWLTDPDTIYRFYDTLAPPVASFTVSSSTPLAGDVVTFNGSASYDSDGSIESYAWDFGDGSSASGALVTHGYATYGVYNATLVVRDFDNLTGSQTTSIRVLAMPTASFAFGPPKPLEGAAVTFDASNSTDPDGSITDYQWDWGDGSGSTFFVSSVAQHTFATFGQYAVNLTVTDSDGLTNTDSLMIQVYASPSAVLAFSPFSPRAGEAVTLDGTGSSDADGTIVQYAWDLGDGTTASGPTVAHTFAAGNYSITLTVTDNDDFTAAASDTLSVRPLRWPEASFSESAALVSPGTNVTFNASHSSDVDGTIVEYTWDFGDESTDSGIAVVHAYPVSGLYTVTLTVLDNDGLANSTTQDVQVNAPPVAAFAILPTAPFAGDAISFDGSASRDPEGSLATFAWDFGDNTPVAAGMIVSHAYAQAGTYLVRLVVTDSVGLTDTKSMSVAVRQNQPPVAVLAPTPARVNPGDPITFDASGSTDSDGSIVSYSWAFGDGATADGVLRVYAYTAPGTYTVALTVTDDRGAFQRAFVAVEVNAPPVASFVATPGLTYPGLYVTFNASASVDSDSAIVSYHWDFGDGTTATGAVVVHAFADHGSFTVGLVVTDDLGAQNQATMAIEVGNRAPIVESTSPQDSLVVNASESTTLQVGAFDPDGDPLTYTWTVDGVAAGGSSPSFEFVRSETGTFVVKVVVSDGSATTDFQWVVEVQERNAPAGSPWSLTSVASIGIAVGVLLAALLIVILLIHRRRSR